MTAGAALFLGFLVLQRLSELVIARRNTARLLAAGAREVAPGHYPVIVAMQFDGEIEIAGVDFGKVGRVACSRIRVPQTQRTIEPIPSPAGDTDQPGGMFAQRRQ